MLTGQAKIDYQREYMRRRRSNAKRDTVRPATVYPVRPKEQMQPPKIETKPAGLSANQWAYIQSRADDGQA